MDEEDACDPAQPLSERGLAISRAMESVMRGCDAMIVNLTPFRGPSALTHSDATGSRASLARMEAADAVQMKGLGCASRSLR